MIAKGFKPVGWVAGIGAAALSCYMLSLQVASERADLAGVERQIVAARQNIRALQTELGTRGRLTQLERWNAEVLALSAPSAQQFLDSGVRLAAFDTRRPDFGDTAAQVRLASAETAAAPRQAVVELRPDEVDAPARDPLIRRASLVLPERPSLAEEAPVIRASSLLDETTLRELRARSTTEQDEGAGN